MPEIQHLSYSSVSTYLECPRKWHYRYVEKIPTPSSPSLVFGSAFHATVEHLISAPIRGDIVDPYDVWSSNWRHFIDTEVDWGAEIPEELREDGFRILHTPAVQDAIKQLVPAVDENGPMIERRFELRIPGVEVPVIGFIDLVTTDGTIHDLKTASRAWTQSQAGQEMQPNVYLAAANQLGLPHKPGKFVHVVFTKTKNPQVQFIETERSTHDTLFVLTIIRQVWKGIEAGVFPPNPKACHNWGRQCEFWGMCRGKQ